MAFYANNKNVGAYLFLNKDEILITNQETVNFKAIREQKVLKCVSSGSDSTSEAPANSTKKPEKVQSFITSAALSNCNTLVAAGDSNNRLFLWKIENKEWKIVSIRSLVRKCQKIIFTNSATDIVLTDRGGDVFSFSIPKFDERGRFLLGHISLILDISISCNDKYLATCDRDGKIRVSCFPNSYNIVSYCLGHQEFVTSVKFLPDTKDTLLSCSGDGTLRLWDLQGDMKEAFYLHESDVLCKHCDINVGEEKNEFLTQSDKLALSENQVLFSIRNVIYNAKLKVCGVLFHLQSGIAIYHLPNWALKQFIPLKTPALDAIFTVKGDLFVLSKDKDAALIAFEYNEVSQIFSKVEDNISPGLSAIAAFYKDHERIPFQDDFVSLFKRVYDTPDEDEDCSKPNEKKNKTDQI